jgi:hypothetical protein
MFQFGASEASYGSSAGMSPARGEQHMTSTTDHTADPSEQAIALFLQENDMDKLTDVLVNALSEAFRIMDDDTVSERLH